MRYHLFHYLMRAFIGLVALAVLIGPLRSANALPAYANRLGVNCATCHTPVFPHLNRTGWLFRRLGYRMPNEIGKNLLPGTPKENEPEDTKRYNYADSLSLMARMRYDDIARQGAQRFSQPYVQNIVGFYSGPAAKNWGYFVEANLLEHAPTFNKAAKRFDVPESEFELEFAELKYFTGKPTAFFSTKLGNFGFGGVDVTGAGDRPIATGRPMMFTQGINAFSQDATQTGADLGYTVGDNHFSVIYLNGVNSEGVGDTSRPINSPDWLFQYIRWLGKSGSSAQLLYYTGKTPLDDSANFVDSFDRLMLLANWRLPLGERNAFELLAGYMNGSHHRAILTGGAPTGIDGTFGVNSYFLEAEYALDHRTVPYLRFDALHSDEAPYAASTFPGNPGRNTRQWTLGVAHMLSQNIRTNLEWVGTRRNPGPNQDLVRAQLWFMW